MSSLIFDSHEHDLIALATKKRVIYTVQTLDVGDICICIDSTPFMIFERKTISDLYASINDGRYHEQKSRMVSNHKRNGICYIIEGDYASSPHLNTVMGAILNTSYRDNIRVHCTKNLNDTLLYVTSLFERITKKTDEWKKYMLNENNDDCLKIDPSVYKHPVKSKNITNNIVFVNMLSCIPGCSTRIASIIHEIYPTINSLIDALKEDPDILVNIKIGSKKLGPALSKKIYNFLFQE